MPLEKELADASLDDKEPIAATSGERAAHTEIKSIPANYTMIQVGLSGLNASHARWPAELTVIRRISLFPTPPAVFRVVRRGQGRPLEEV